MSIGMDNVKIFIRQIVPSGKSHFPVNHGNFPVVSVIHKNLHSRHHRVKHFAPDSQGLHPFDKLRGNKTNAPHIIIDNPNFHPGSGLPCQDIPDFPERLRLLNGVVIHKNILFSLF